VREEVVPDTMLSSSAKRDTWRRETSSTCPVPRVCVVSGSLRTLRTLREGARLDEGNRHPDGIFLGESEVNSAIIRLGGWN
jgi:hypothetical protein